MFPELKNICSDYNITTVTKYRSAVRYVSRTVSVKTLFK